MPTGRVKQRRPRRKVGRRTNNPSSLVAKRLRESLRDWYREFGDRQGPPDVDLAEDMLWDYIAGIRDIDELLTVAPYYLSEEKIHRAIAQHVVDNDRVDVLMKLDPQELLEAVRQSRHKQITRAVAGAMADASDARIRREVLRSLIREYE